MRHVALISTGGTIEKTYDERTGKLENRASIVQRMLARLRLEDVTMNSIQLLSKDSQHFTDADRTRILDMTRVMMRPNNNRSDNNRSDNDPSEQAGDIGGDPDHRAETNGIVILHGTDTLSITGELLHREIPEPAVPIILTAAMRPFEMKRSDALQNLTEAIFATGALPPGVYACAHGRALRFPGVVKDRERGTFVRGEG
ncbi:MAG: asparaginase domain-containing protein [Planctomycetota bacterium]